MDQGRAGTVQVSSPTQLFGANILRRLEANGWDMDKALRTNATLPHDAWIAVDKALVEVARRRLNGIADLKARGLVRPLPDMGVMYDYWQRMEDNLSAEVNMSGITQGTNNANEFDEVAVPIPIVHCDFTIPMRKMLAMKRYGVPLDTTMVSQAGQAVADKLEDILFNGSSLVSGGHHVYGYLSGASAVYSSEVACTGNWTGTPANILVDIRKLIKAALDDYHYGPFVLYVATKEWNDLGAVRDYTDRTYLEIVKNMPEIAEVKHSGVIPARSIVLVEMSPATVDLSVAVDLKVVEWDTYGGMQSNFKVLACMAPRIKYDSNSRSGIAFDNDLGTS